VIFGFAAYLLWGAFPLYFRLMERSGPIEVVAHRALWSLVFCVLALTVLRQSVPALPGLAIETLAIAPLALGYIIWLEAAGADSVEIASPYGLLMASTGIVTAVPLLLFAAAAARVPLVTIGMLQYITPTLQFAVGWLVFHEPMPPERWAGFVLVWAAVVVFTVDGVRRHLGTPTPSG